VSTVAVAGGGIGGLAAALAAGDRGHHVVVLERAARFAEFGAGIQIAPNGMHALGRLGLADAVRRIAVPVTELRLMDGVTGRHVVSVPLDAAYRARFHHPYVVAHRGELHRILLRAAERHERVDLRPGTPVTGYVRRERGVLVRLGRGPGLVADALIGADGLHSAVRAQLLGDGPPRNAGITVYRSTVAMDRVPDDLRRQAVTWWTGPGRHFVHYPIEGGRSLNLAPSVENRPGRMYAGLPVSAAEVRSEFAAFCDPARRLLDLGTVWRAWVLVDREPAGAWTDGPVALLGDAAHPMLHYAAQGACQALEDAVALGEVLEPAGAQSGFAVPLARYAAARGERTARVQRLARDSVRLWHATGAALAARDEALGRMAAADLHARLAWLHSPQGRVAAPANPAHGSDATRDGPEPASAAATGADVEPGGTYTLAGYLPPADCAQQEPAEAPGTYTQGGFLDPPHRWAPDGPA
jgi:2-polyprenyl-6-methoxyphenol hydroxylase-like FAD-dependent oxidoreductase